MNKTYSYNRDISIRNISEYISIKYNCNKNDIFDKINKNNCINYKDIYYKIVLYDKQLCDLKLNIKSKEYSFSNITRKNAINMIRDKIKISNIIGILLLFDSIKNRAINKFKVDDIYIEMDIK